MLRKLYGNDFRQEFAKQRPKGFDARAQLFDRLAKGDDRMCVLAEYAGYALFAEKGADIEFVAPADGLPATPIFIGAVNRAPHPEAAKLFVDWALSRRGQQVYQNQKIDEPLSNLDAKLRAEMRVELKELQRRLDITSVYVTHDLEEALAISDRIVVMRDGVIEQVGTPAEIYDRPRNTFVADFVGSANLIRGRRRPDLESDGSAVLETTSGALVHGIAAGRGAAGAALMAVRTVRLRLDRERPGTAVNSWPARVRQRVFQGDFTQYHVEWDGRTLIVRSAAPDAMAEGDAVFVSVEPRHCVLLEE